MKKRAACPEIKAHGLMAAQRPPRGLAPWMRLVREQGPTPYSQTNAARILSPIDAFQACGDLSALEVESFVVLCLNTQKRLIARAEVSRGTLDSTPVHAREVFRLAIALGAAAVICVHNHPSGDPFPSADDYAITVSLSAAGKLLGIPLLDHIIIGDRTYFSFEAAGTL